MINQRSNNGSDLSSNLENLAINGNFQFNFQGYYSEFQDIVPSLDQDANGIPDAIFCNLWANGRNDAPGYQARHSSDGFLWFRGQSNGTPLEILNLGTRFPFEEINPSAKSPGFIFVSEETNRCFFTAAVTIHLLENCAELDVSVYPRNRLYAPGDCRIVYTTNRRLRPGEGEGPDRNHFTVLTTVEISNLQGSVPNLQDMAYAGLTVRAGVKANVNYQVMNFREVFGKYDDLPEYMDPGPFATWRKIEDVENILGIQDDRAHNGLTGIQGGSSTERYHMTQSQWEILTNEGGVQNADSQHSHDITQAITVSNTAQFLEINGGDLYDSEPGLLGATTIDGDGKTASTSCVIDVSNGINPSLLPVSGGAVTQDTLVGIEVTLQSAFTVGSPPVGGVFTLDPYIGINQIRFSSTSSAQATVYKGGPYDPGFNASPFPETVNSLSFVVPLKAGDTIFTINLDFINSHSNSASGNAGVIRVRRVWHVAT